MAAKKVKSSKSITNELVQTKGQQVFTTSLAIAAGVPVERKNKQTGIIEACEREHKDVIALIRKYQSDFEEFGQLTFETRVVSAKGTGQATEYAILTEDQATYLITLFTNSASVRKFKIRLVKEFRKALNFVAANFANPPRAGLIQDKRSAHHPMMDALVDLRAALGKETSTVHFMCENKLCNGVVTGDFKSAKEGALSNDDVVLLAEVRRMNQSMLQMDMSYEERKKKLVAFATRQRTNSCGARRRLYAEQ